MRRTLSRSTLVVLALAAVTAIALGMGPLSPDRRMRTLAIAATSDDAAVAKEARASLRAAGPDGLAALRLQFRPEIAKALDGTLPPGDPAWRRIREAIDAVAAQRDAHTSGLYWYTDLDAARRAARAGGKPILSLRLLGTLDSELSCANSRFFRTALYANSSVARYLSDHFVLHWKSVRPVPRVTIDMGDGRTIYRTITGNSIHYVLDADGRPIDAVPGLYGPAAFLRAVSGAANIEEKLRGLNGGDRADALALWHGEQVRITEAAWRDDLNALGVSAASFSGTPAAPPVDAPPALPTELPSARVAVETAVPKADATERRLVREVVPPAAPPANAAAKLAIGKRRVEAPLVAELAGVPAAGQIAPAPAAPAARVAANRAVGKGLVEKRLVDQVVAAPPVPPQDLAAATPQDLWPRIARLHAADALLDDGSRRLVRSKFPAAKAAGRAALAKLVVEDPLIRTIANFERSVAEDTVRNEYTFHRQIHAWFGQQQAQTGDVDALNKRVYAELFLTPDSDPWLGLVPPDTYSALQDDGMTEACLK
jgi:hypothetical protein